MDVSLEGFEARARDAEERLSRIEAKLANRQGGQGERGQVFLLGGGARNGSGWHGTDLVVWCGVVFFFCTLWV